MIAKINEQNANKLLKNGGLLPAHGGCVFASSGGV